MPTVAEVLARTLADAGVTRMFGVPGGEVLEFLDAARVAGIDFVLTRHEAQAAFMADAAGQLGGVPGVSVSTLGPGAVNMVLGVANAYLDRSPVVAITGALATSAAPFATHQNVDLARLYGPITKDTLALDGRDTAATVLGALRTALDPRPGPVHVALPSDVARKADVVTGTRPLPSLAPPSVPPPSPDALARFCAALSRARRPVVILGLDLAPYRQADLVRRVVEHVNVPTFVAPKAKGVLAEDHPLFFGVCAGVAADHVILDFFSQADLLVGIGYEPVESNRLWHHTMKLASAGPVSIAAGDYVPHVEVVGDVGRILQALLETPLGPYDWPPDALAAYRRAFEAALNGPAATGLSPRAVTARLRALMPRNTMATTDVGAVKFIVSQAWTAYEGGTLLQSNGLSSMGFGFPAAIAASLACPDRPVLCMVGDGGFAMSLLELETCVRRGLPVLTVVYNDRRLSLIEVIQANKGLPKHAVEYGWIDFARAAESFGAWGRRVRSLDELEEAVRDARRAGRPAVIDALVDPAEYASQTRPW